MNEASVVFRREFSDSKLNRYSDRIFSARIFSHSGSGCGSFEKFIRPQTKIFNDSAFSLCNQHNIMIFLFRPIRIKQHNRNLSAKLRCETDKIYFFTAANGTLVAIMIFNFSYTKRGKSDMKQQNAQPSQKCALNKQRIRRKCVEKSDELLCRFFPLKWFFQIYAGKGFKSS